MVPVIFQDMYSYKSYKNLYKIGWTSLTPEERADQLSSETGVLYPFKVIFKKLILKYIISEF